MQATVYIFKCTKETLPECLEKGVFGSASDWPLRLKQGDFCCLSIPEASEVYLMFRATCNGGVNLVPEAFGGRLPYQVKVTRVSSELSKLQTRMDESFINPSTGTFENVRCIASVDV